MLTVENSCVAGFLRRRFWKRYTHLPQGNTMCLANPKLFYLVTTNVYKPLISVLISKPRLLLKLVSWLPFSVMDEKIAVILSMAQHFACFDPA